MRAAWDPIAAYRLSHGEMGEAGLPAGRGAKRQDNTGRSMIGWKRKLSQERSAVDVSRGQHGKGKCEFGDVPVILSGSHLALG